MQIVMCYGDSPSTTGSYLAAAFRGQGHDVRLFDLGALRRSGPNAPFRYLGKQVPFVSTIDAARLMKTRGWRPDLFLWVESPRGVEVKIRTQMPSKTACYVIDTHTQREKLLGLSRQYDTVFVAQRDDATEFAKAGLNAHWLPLAADPAVHAPVEVPVEFDVGFVGRIESDRYRERFHLLRQLSSEFKVHVATAYGIAMAAEYRRCKVGFNKSLKGDLNMRVFEVMAMGVPLVTDRIGNGLGSLFDEGKHYLAYDDGLELRRAVAELCQDEEARQTMGLAARKRILEGHTYSHRASAILSAVGT